MALLLSPTVAASPAAAEFEFTSATLSGQWQAADPAQRANVFVPAETGGDRFSWALDAQHVRLNWSSTSRYEVTRPASSSTMYMAKEPPRQWDEGTTATNAFSQSRSGASNILIVGQDATLPKAAAQTSEILIGNAPSTWLAGSEPRADVATDAPGNTQVRHEVPSDHLQIEVQNATLSITGDFAIAVWDAAINLNESGTWRTVETGRTEADAGPNVRETEYRLLWIFATNATLFLDLHGGLARLASQQYDLDGTGLALFQGSQGTLTVPSATHSLDRKPLRVTGALDLQLRKRPSSEAGASLEVTEGLVDVGGARFEASSTIPDVGRSMWHWAWALVALVPIVWMGVRRFGPVTIDDVEWSILAGQSRRSHRLARRLVGKNPRDPDAVFLYGTTLLARGKLASLVETIEPLSLKIARKERRGIAFVLAVAAHGSNDARRARRWANEAAQDPQLRDQLEKQGILQTQPSVTLSGYA